MSKAKSVRKKLVRERRIMSAAYSCEQCGKFHLKLVDAQTHTADKEIVRLMALGLTASEIANDLNMTKCVVEKRIQKMKDRLYATSASNLVAMCIAFGEVSIESLLPEVSDKTHP